MHARLIPSSLLLGALLVSGLALAGAPPKSTPELIAKGKTAYTTTCVACHGEKGDGNGPAGAALNPKPRDLTVKNEKVGAHYKKGGTAAQLFESISTGLPGTAMAGFAAAIPEETRWGMVYYIQSELQKGKK